MVKLKSYIAEFGLIWKIITPFWKSEQKYKAWAMLIAILIVNALIVYGMVELNKWSNNLFNTIQEKNLQEFYRQLSIFVPIVIAIVIIFNINDYLVAILKFNWRQWMTTQLSDKWLYNNNFYRVMQLRHHPDNPDQRISEDLASFTTNALSLFIILFKETLSVVSFGVVLWNLSSPINLHIFGNDINIQGTLLWIALLYCITGTIITIFIGKPLVPLDFAQEKYEANFRYSLIRIREKREEIALYKGSNTEVKSLKECFNLIRNNYINIVYRTIYLDIWRNLYINLDTVFPYIIASPMYFSGAITLGAFMQISGAFGSVEKSLSAIVYNFTAITAWIATSRRLLQLEQHLEDAKLAHKHSKVVLTHTNGKTLICEELSLFKPDNSPLLLGIDFRVEQGDKIMITGPSGIGKSTLIRAIAGLWPYGSGSITLPKAEIFFVPQKPYLPIDTLYNAIIYPECDLDRDPDLRQDDNRGRQDDNRGRQDDNMRYQGDDTGHRDDVCKFLDLLELTHLIKDLDINQDWSMALSLGEQQRIAILRLLIHKPEWIIMDEPTSSLDKSLQNKCFELLSKYLKNSTIITVAHDIDLNKYHSRVISFAKTDA